MHYCIAVLGDDPEKTIEKYDENLSGVFLKPKKQFIKEKRNYNEWYKKHYYDVFIENEEEYKKKHPYATEVHLEHVKNFMTEYNMTDDEIMQREYDNHKRDNDICPNQYAISDCGGIYMPYNHLGKWDWYQIGGRWSNMLKLKEPGKCKLQGKPSLLFTEEEKKEIQKEKDEGFHCDSALIKDIDFDNMPNFSCYGLVLENGDWYDKDYCIINEKYEDPLEEDEMKDFFNEMLKSLPETTLITIIDIHA